MGFEKKRAKWEADQAERESKKAEFDKKKARWEERQAVRLATKLAKNEASAARDWDTKSDISEATTSTAATVTFSNEEVRCLAAKDKEVRKLEKVLREIAKLEECQHLDPLQTAKVARKLQVEVELETARGLAEARVRNELRQQAVHSLSVDFLSCMD